MEIQYSNQSIPVREGDHVEYRSFFFWRGWKPGRISHVPGISSPHPEMEHDGLTWVGVSGSDGTFRGVLVDPDSGHLKKTVRFIGRSTDEHYLKPSEIQDDDW